MALMASCLAEWAHRHIAYPSPCLRRSALHTPSC